MTRLWVRSRSRMRACPRRARPDTCGAHAGSMGSRDRSYGSARRDGTKRSSHRAAWPSASASIRATATRSRQWPPAGAKLMSTASSSGTTRASTSRSASADTSVDGVRYLDRVGVARGHVVGTIDPEVERGAVVAAQVLVRVAGDGAAVALAAGSGRGAAVRGEELVGVPVEDVGFGGGELLTGAGTAVSIHRDGVTRTRVGGEAHVDMELVAVRVDVVERFECVPDLTARKGGVACERHGGRSRVGQRA